MAVRKPLYRDPITGLVTEIHQNDTLVGSQFVQAQVDFGHASGGQGSTASVTVPATWVTTSSIIVCTFAGVATADHDPQDAVLEELIASAINLVPGVSFDIFAYAPNGTWGRYLVNATGK